MVPSHHNHFVFGLVYFFISSCYLTVFVYDRCFPLCNHCRQDLGAMRFSAPGYLCCNISLFLEIYTCEYAIQMGLIDNLEIKPNVSPITLFLKLPNLMLSHSDISLCSFIGLKICSSVTTRLIREIRLVCTRLKNCNWKHKLFLSFRLYIFFYCSKVHGFTTLCYSIN